MKNPLQKLFLRDDQSSRQQKISTESSEKKLISSLNTFNGKIFKKIKYIGKVLSGKEKKILRNTSFLIGGSLAALFILFYINNFVEVPLAGGEYTEALVGRPEFINPLLSQTSDVDTDISKLIFSGLMKYNKDLELVTDLASAYETSEDQKTYTFHLRKDVAWHDGEKFSANDVIFTYQSIQDAEFKSPLQVSFRGVEIKKIDDSTVSFILSEPYPAFLETLTTGILPEHIWVNIPPINSNLTEYNIKPIGTGAWKFKTIAKDRLGNIKSYTIVENENYYGQKSFLTKIIFKFYPDFQTALIALNNRSVEGISFLPKGLESNIQNNQAKFYSFYLPQYTGVFFNQKENEFLKEKNIRKALVLSIDKTRILTEALLLKGEIIYGPILPGFPGYDPSAQKYAFNPEEAATLLKDAGWTRISKAEYLEMKKEIEEKKQETESAESETTSETENETEEVSEQVPSVEIEKPAEELQDWYLKAGEKIFEIKLTTINIQENIKAAEIIKNFWQKIGVKVNLEIIEDARITREVIKPRNYESLLFGIILGIDPDPYPFWHSSQIQDPGLNLSLFANRKVDQLLEQAKTENDNEKRAELLKQFQDIIIEEIPALFLYNPTYTYVNHKKIQGIDIERVILPYHRFNNLDEWYIKTGRRLKKNVLQ